MEASLPAPEAEVLDVDHALRELALVEPRLLWAHALRN